MLHFQACESARSRVASGFSNAPPAASIASRASSNETSLWKMTLSFAARLAASGFVQRGALDLLLRRQRFDRDDARIGDVRAGA